MIKQGKNDIRPVFDLIYCNPNDLQKNPFDSSKDPNIYEMSGG